MKLEFRWTKRADGALDPAFVAPLVEHFGLSAFIETGTYLGDTLATMRGLFQTLVSIELAPQLAESAESRFADDPAITIIRGDSATGLGEAFRRVGPARAFIWLDAHYSGGPTAKGDGNTPILTEVARILADRDGRDVVVIDDARLFWPLPHGFLDHESLSGYPPLSEVARMFLQGRHDLQVFCMGDTLLVTPRGVEPSAVLEACTQSRLAAPGARPDGGTEQTIRAASGAEADHLGNPGAVLESQRDYGVGGHYFYWRGLQREREGRHTEAAEDFAFAERCRVTTGRGAGPVAKA